MSTITGNECAVYFVQGTVSNIDKIALTADVTIEETLYQDINIHYHCDAAGTVHSAAPFLDSDNVVVMIQNGLPVNIVGFPDSPRLCGSILIEQVNGTKEIYNPSSGLFSEYIGGVDEGHRFFYCPPEDTGCDNNYGITNAHNQSSIIYGAECPPESGFELTKVTNDYTADYSSDFATLVDFMTANRVHEMVGCLNCGAVSNISTEITGVAEKKNVYFDLNPIYTFLEPVAEEDFEKRPSIVNTLDIEKFIVLSYASSREYYNNKIYNDCGGPDIDILYSWTDYILFCVNHACTEFEPTFNSTSDGADRYIYSISDWQVYLHEYKQSAQMFFSVFKAGGSYYAHKGIGADASVTIERDSVFETHFDGKNILKVSFA